MTIEEDGRYFTPPKAGTGELTEYILRGTSGRDSEPKLYVWRVPSPYDDYPRLRLEGEEMLQFLDATGAGWMREVCEDMESDEVLGSDVIE